MMSSKPVLYMGTFFMNYSVGTPTSTTESVHIALVSHGDYVSDQSFVTTDQSIDNTTSDPNIQVRSCAATILLATILGAIVILTVTGNVLVIASVVLNANLRTTTNYFIANLAIADLLLGTTVLPFSATLEVLQYWVFGQIFCDVWAAIDVLCCTASILSLCVISIDRYIGVTRPLQHARIIRHTRAVYVIIFVWLLSIAISVAPLIGWKEEPDPDPRICTVTTQPGYVLFSVAGSFYIPCLIILVVYFRIYRETVKYTRCLMSGAKMAKVDEENVVSLRIHTGRNVSANTPKDGYQTIVQDCIADENSSVCGTGTTPQHLHKKDSNKRNSRLTFSNKVAKFKREKKAAKTLGIVVGVFITCWLPFFVTLPVDSLCPDCSVPPILFKLFFWLGYCNSTMNPIIYTCSSTEFRRAFLAILCCRRCRRRPRVSLTELQLRARAHRGSRGRTLHRQQQQKQQHQHRDMQLPLREMSSSSSSPPGSIAVVVKEPGFQLTPVSPPQTHVNNGSVVTENKKCLGLKGPRKKDSKCNMCTKCKTTCCYQNGIGNVPPRPQGLGQNAHDSDLISQQQVNSRKTCPKEQENVNGKVLTFHSSTPSTPSRPSSPENTNVCGGTHQLPWTMNCRGSAGCGCPTKDSDVAGSDGLSCYSLAETISCSD